MRPNAQVFEQQTRNFRLLYLDGLRGLSAVLVMLGHAKSEAELSGNYSHQLDLVLFWLNYGHFYVAVFVMISGFSLMIPVVRNGEGYLPGGVKKYIVRRARRICPPYYAALTLYVLLLYSRSVCRLIGGTSWGIISIHSLDPMTVVSHLLLIHDFSKHWMYKIDAPMWSVAPEWNFYFLLPLVLLPSFRKFGIRGLLTSGFVLGLFIRPLSSSLFDSLATWYFALFAMGCSAAAVVFSTKHKALCIALRSQVLLTAGFCAALLLVPAVTDGGIHHVYLGDLILGPPLAFLLCNLALRPQSWIKQILEFRPIVWLGTISYSLYLIHYPLISLVSGLTRGLECRLALCLIVIGAPLASIAAAYLFHLMFERPFMGLKKQTEGAAARAAIVEPAP